MYDKFGSRICILLISIRLYIQESLNSDLIVRTYNGKTHEKSEIFVGGGTIHFFCTPATKYMGIGGCYLFLDIRRKKKILIMSMLNLRQFHKIKFLRTLNLKILLHKIRYATNKDVINCRIPDILLRCSLPVIHLKSANVDKNHFTCIIVHTRTLL